MAVPQDAFSTAYAKQMEMAQQCFGFGMEVAQRMLAAQIEGSRQLFELQGRPFGTLDAAAGNDPATQWAAYWRQIMGGTEATEVWMRTASAIQAESLRLMEQFFPMIGHSLTDNLERATEMLAATAGKAESSRKRAA